MARPTLAAPNFADCLTIGEAAEFLGVSTATLRNWDRSGKLKPRRHPQNSYRIYLHEDLEAVLRSADLSTLTDEAFAPQVDWTKMRDSEHFVQFYEHDEFLIESVGGFIGAALSGGDCAVVVATPEHRQVVQRKLTACGIDVAEAEAVGRYVVLDASAALSKFMVNGSPNARRFQDSIGPVIATLAQNGQRVHAFGEMVALLWNDGNRKGAIELEQLWNDLAQRHRFALFCAYPINGFGDGDQSTAFDGVCACHTRVIPAESYAAVDSEDKRLRAISLLQQKAHSLQAEIEHRQEVENALAKRERELNEFLATLSHELRNSLAPIRNALELLDSDPLSSAARTEATRVFRRQVEQLTRLVDDLLDISRITRDKIKLRNEDVDLASIIDNAIETSRPVIDAAGHQLNVSLPNRTVHLYADRARLTQVFANLLDNAAKFTPPGGQIQIDARHDGREVVVSVRDNGVGISSAMLDCVFDTFRQADQSLEKPYGGLGIGLTMVRRLVELHSGTVIAHSAGPGKGSKFTVRLPVVLPAPRATKALKSGVQAAFAIRRILVVDDNEDSGDTLSILLRVKGHDVCIARNGLEAIDKAAEFRPEIILMDVGMPKLNGHEATRRIRATPHGRDIFIVALTGWGQPSDVARSLEAGCSAHLVKPVDFAALDRLLATATTGG